MWTDAFVRRPVMAMVLSLVILLLGAVSLPRLGVQETPDLDAPTVTVSTVWLGADPSIVQTEVTEVLERELNGIEGLELIRSESREQVSQITLEFALERELEAAANDVRDRVSRSRRNLPDDVEEPVVEKADGDTQPVMYLRLLGDRSLLELSDIADRLVRERLQTVPGVSAIQLFGERRYAMRVELDLPRLSALGLTVAEITAALDAQNVEAPAGRVEGVATDLALRVDAGLATPEAFADLVIARRGDAVVRLGDVAFVRLGAEDERTAARSEGIPAVTLTVIPQSGANIVAISDEVRARQPSIQADLPEGISLEASYDRSLPVRRGIRDVVGTLFLSTLAVVLIIGAFLRDVRATLIPTAAIVVSLVGTFAFFELAGFTINVFTLFGLVLAIGIVVDDAIVVLENVWRRIEAGEAPFDAALLGTREMVFPVIATTLSLLAVFLPVIFAGGTSGRLFLEFGATVAVAVSLSSVVALTLSPALCALLLRRTGRGSEEATGALRASFARSLAPVVGRPLLSWVAVLVSLGLGAWMLASAPREFFPVEDRSFFMVRAIGPEGVGFAWMDARIAEVEPLLMAAIPERTSLISRVALSRGSGPGAANTGNFGIPLVPPEERTRSQAEIVASLRPLLAEITAFRAIPSQFPTVGRGMGAPLQIAVLADDSADLEARLPEIEEVARSVPGLVGLDVDLKLNRPEVRVIVDREKAAALGVSTRDVARTLQVLTTGLELSRFKLRERQYNVIVGLAPEHRATTAGLLDLSVAAADGRRVPLSTLAHFEERSATSSRYRVARSPSVTISANVDGIALGEGIERLRNALEARFGPTQRAELLGQSRELEAASGTLGLVFALAVALVYLVLAAQFDSFRDPLPILASLPVAVVAGVGAVLALGEALSFFTQVGLVLLVGLVTKNGILIVEFARQVQADEGLAPLEAARRAAELRLRPILMTATSTIGGALPIALGSSGESRAGLGVVVVAGMAAATLLSLYVTPALWAALARVPLRVPVASAVALLLALVTAEAQAQPLDLDAALRAAETSNPTLAAARADADAARRRVWVLRGAVLPSVSAQGRVQYGNTFVAGGAGVGGDPFAIATVSATLGVPLVDASGWAAVAASVRRADLEAARADAIALGLLQEVALAFVAAQRADAALEVARANVARAEALLARSRDRVAVGAAPPIEAIRAEVVLLQDQLAVLEAARDVRAAEATLAARLGVASAPDVVPLAPLSPPSPAQLALVPSLIQARAEADAARAELRAGRMAFVPRLSGFGTAGTLNRFDGPWLPTLSAGLEATWTPLGAGAIAELSQRAELLRAATLRAEAMALDVGAALAIAQAELDATQAGLVLADAALALADAELAEATDRYEFGADDQLPVVEAQRRRAALGIAKVEAVAAYNRAVVGLAVAWGVLGAQ